MRPFAIFFVLVCGQAAYGQASLLIEATAPGYAPHDVERAVLAPLENYLNGVEGVQHMRGLAADGKCVIRLDLDGQTDPQLARTLVENRMRLAKPNLPPPCAAEILPAADGAFMLLAVQPADDMTWDLASSWANVTVRPLLAGVPGVAQIHTIGAVGNQLQVTIDRDRLLAYHLAAADVVAAVQASRKNFDRLSMDGIKVAVKETMLDLGNIPIRAGKNVYLRDIAAVKLVDETAQDARIFRRGEKEPKLRRAVFVLVELAPGKASSTAIRDIQKVVARLRDILPKEMRVESRVLRAQGTTVVVQLPDDIGINGRREKAIAAAKAMSEVSKIDTMFTIARLDTGKLIAYVFADDAKSTELHRSLRAKLADVEGTTARVGGLVSPIFSWPGQGAQFLVRLRGNDLQKLQKAAELLRTGLGKTPGLVDIHQFPKLRRELALEIDRERMGITGVQPADLVNALAPQHQPIFGWPLPFIVTVPPPLMSEAPKKMIAEMGILPVRSSVRGPAVLLRDVAKIGTIIAPNAILHEGGRPCVTVFGNAQGHPPEEACAAIRRLAQELADKETDVEVECLGKTIPGAPAQPGPARKNEQKPKARIIEPTPVMTVMPRRITLTRRIEQPGYVMSLDSTPIYSKIAGFAEKWRVDIGDYVKKDELLVKLFIPEVAQELKIKEARVEQAEADLKLAKENVLAAKAAEDAAKARIAQAAAEVEQCSAEVSRAKELLKNLISDQATVDKCVNRWKVSKAVKDACDADWREKSALRSARQAGVEVAEAGIQVAKASYQQWKAWTAYAEIRAPYDGIITQRNVSTGDFVQPPFGSKNKAEPLFVVERYDIMRVVVQVPEMEARAVKKGDKAVFFAQALPGQDLSGTVTRQSLALDVNSRTLRVECDLPNADQKLRPGMYVRAVIIGKIENAWVLPAAAVMNDILADRDIRYCFQVVNGVARRLNLEVGLPGDEGIEVLRKQEPGSKNWMNFSGQEAIVVTNVAGLVDGQAVAPKPAEPKKKQ